MNFSIWEVRKPTDVIAVLMSDDDVSDQGRIDITRLKLPIDGFRRIKCGAGHVEPILPQPPHRICDIHETDPSIDDRD
ncbi:hypothetical protein TSST111916_15995 [Tsukamurella strandjordii]|nr:hypothetical protein [Tsukamurella sp. TY48]